MNSHPHGSDGTTGETRSDSADTGTGHFSRKAVLRAAVAAGISTPVALLGGPALARTVAASGKTPELTPACDDGDDPTPPQTEGPYFKPNSPQRDSLLEPGMRGTRLTVSGYVFGLSCQPLSDVLLDFWQADYYGKYDHVGYTLRGISSPTRRAGSR